MTTLNTHHTRTSSTSRRRGRTAIAATLALSVLAGAGVQLSTANLTSASATSDIVVNHARMWLDPMGDDHRVRVEGFTPGATARLRIERDGRWVTNDDGTTFQVLCCAADEQGSINTSEFRLGRDQILSGDRIVIAEQHSDDRVGEHNWIDERATHLVREHEVTGPRVILSRVNENDLRVRVNVTGYTPGGHLLRAMILRDGRWVQDADGDTFFKDNRTRQDSSSSIAATAWSFAAGSEIRIGDVIVVRELIDGKWIERAATTFFGVDDERRPLQPRVWLEPSGSTHKIRVEGFAPNATLRLRGLRDGEWLRDDSGRTYQNVCCGTDGNGHVNATAFHLGTSQFLPGDTIVIAQRNPDVPTGWVRMAELVMNEEVRGPRADLVQTDAGYRLDVSGFSENTGIRVRVYRDGRALDRYDVSCVRTNPEWQDVWQFVGDGTNFAGEKSYSLEGLVLRPGDEVRVAEYRADDRQGEPRWLERKAIVEVDRKIGTCGWNIQLTPDHPEVYLFGGANWDGPIERVQTTGRDSEQTYVLPHTTDRVKQPSSITVVPPCSDYTPSQLAQEKDSVTGFCSAPSQVTVWFCTGRADLGNGGRCFHVPAHYGNAAVVVSNAALVSRDMDNSISTIVFQNGTPRDPSTPAQGSVNLDSSQAGGFLRAIDFVNDGGDLRQVADVDFAIPSNALPAAAIPSNALPAAALPAGALPAAAIPSNALPAAAIPSNALPAA